MSRKSRHVSFAVEGLESRELKTSSLSLGNMTSVHATIAPPRPGDPVEVVMSSPTVGFPYKEAGSGGPAASPPTYLECPH